MFGLFKKKDASGIINKVWVSKEQKWNGCLEILKSKPETIFVAWFEETFTELNRFLEQHGHTAKVVMYRQVSHAKAADYIFVEHYPLLTKEEDVFGQLATEKITVLSSLDEPLFKHFGSDKIIDMINKFGMNNGEAIEHALITSSIIKAQEKLVKQVLIDNTARSQKEWMEKNVH